MAISRPPHPLPPTDPPRTPTLTFFQETQGGRLVIVRCTVDSHPPATLTIDHDGAVLATSGAQVATLGQQLGVTASRNSLRLEMRGAGPRASGNYGCTASNAHGSASATKVLEIRRESQRVWGDEPELGGHAALRDGGTPVVALGDVVWWSWRGSWVLIPKMPKNSLNLSRLFHLVHLHLSLFHDPQIWIIWGDRGSRRREKFPKSMSKRNIL